MRAPSTRGDRLVISSVADASPKSYPLARTLQNYRYDDESDQPEAQPNQPLSQKLSFHGGMSYSDYDERTAGAFLNDGMILHEPGIIRPPILPTTVTLTDANHPPMYFFEAEAPVATIDHDASDSITVSSAATGTISNFTVANNSDRILLLHLWVSADVSGMTVAYGGESFSLRASYGSGTIRTYELISPTVQTADIVISWTGDQDAVIIASSYYNVDQDRPFRGITANADSNVEAATDTVTSVAGELVVDVVVVANGPDVTVGASQTNREEKTLASTATLATSTEAGAASVTMSWSWSGAQTYTQVVMPLRPAKTPRFYAISIEPHEVNIYKMSLESGNFATLLNTKTFTVTTTPPQGRPAEFNDGTNTQWRIGLGDNGIIQSLETIAATTSNDTWGNDDADARHLQVVGNELYRSTANNEISVCPVNTDPETEANWNDEFYAGDTATEITELGEASGFSYAAKDDGFYEWGGVGDPENVLPEIGRAKGNGQGMVFYHGGFMVPAASGLWWTRTGTPVGPDDNPHNRANDPSLGNSPYAKHGRWNGLATYGEYIYGLYVTSTGTSAYLYYGRERGEFDPPGWGPIVWHILDLPTATFNDFHGCFVTETSRFSATEARPCLWYADGNNVSYIWLDKDGAPMSRRGDIDLDTLGVATSGQMDFGVGQVNKQLNVIQGWAEDFGSVSGGFAFSVARDGSGFSAVGSAVTADGFFQNFWTQDSNDTARRLISRCAWIGTSSLTDTNGPHLRDVVIRATALPRTTRIWTFLLMVEDDGKTAKKTRSELEGYKNDLLKYKLPDSDTFNGVMTSIRLLRADEIRDLTERNQTPPKFIIEAKVREMLTS